MQDFSYGLFNYQGQEIAATNYAYKILKKYETCSDCKIYITGHSLGGYLAQIGGATMYKYLNLSKSTSKPTLEQIAYFDGMGLQFNKYLPELIQAESKNLLTKFYNEGKDQAGYNKDKLVLYYTYGDPVSALGTHLGNQHGYPAAKDAAKHHNGDFNKIKADLNLGSTNYNINWGNIFTWLGNHNIISGDKTVGQYFDQYKNEYGLNNIIDFAWTAHETDSLLYNISQGTRSWKNYDYFDSTENLKDNIKPTCSLTYPTSIKIGKYDTLTLECSDNMDLDLVNKQISASDITVLQRIKGIKIVNVSDPLQEVGINPPKYKWRILVKGVLLGRYNLSIKAGAVKDKARTPNSNEAFNTKPIKIGLR